MIICLKNDTPKVQKENLMFFLESVGLSFVLNKTEYGDVIVLTGDVSEDIKQMISGYECVASITCVKNSYKLAEKRANEKTVVEVKNKKIGEGFCFVAGPCAVQSEEQIFSIAEKVVSCGADIIRGGAFKPRTSPYSFCGLGKEGIDLLVKAGKTYNVPVVCELTSLKYIDMYANVDIIQVGARNMQNFEMLKELGRSSKPIILKRGFGNTVNELLLSAEYILSAGNPNVILCERGVRSFEPAYRSMLDVSALVYLKQKTHLPVIADPSHACGTKKMVLPLSLACAASGCDGVMIEVDPNPQKALSDASQAIDIKTFENTLKKAKQIYAISTEE